MAGRVVCYLRWLKRRFSAFNRYHYNPDRMNLAVLAGWWSIFNSIQ